MSVYIGGTKVAGLEKELPAQAGNAGKYLYTDGENASWQEAATTQIWIGTQAEYEALGTYDPEVVYEVIDDYSNITPFAKEVAERNIGELVYSTVPVTDAGLHLADGELLDGTGIYADFYNYMVGVYNAGHTSIFTTEATWQTANTTYGKCGKYVLNTTNHTIRLPKIPGFVEGTLTESEIGNRVAPGLPNINGYFQASRGLSRDGITATGCFTASNSGETGSSISGYTSPQRITFNASTSNPIYGASTTVQPESVKLYVYIVIANTVKTPVEVDIDQVATDLAGKVNKGHEVIEFQAPTAQNNYTWYRKYADGWVEQGGLDSTGTANLHTIEIPVAMSIKRSGQVTTYTSITDGGTISTQFDPMNNDETHIKIGGRWGTTWSTAWLCWEVKGMAA